MTRATDVAVTIRRGDRIVRRRAADVDGFGRAFLPDLAIFSVRILDANANPIVRS